MRISQEPHENFTRKSIRSTGISRTRLRKIKGEKRTGRDRKNRNDHLANQAQWKLVKVAQEGSLAILNDRSMPKKSTQVSGLHSSLQRERLRLEQLLDGALLEVGAEVDFLQSVRGNHLLVDLANGVNLFSKVVLFGLGHQDEGTAVELEVFVDRNLHVGISSKDLAEQSKSFLLVDHHLLHSFVEGSGGRKVFKLNLLCG